MADRELNIQRVDSDGASRVRLVDASGNVMDAYSSSVAFVRPSNVAAYTAGDVIGIAASPENDPGSAIHEFTNIGPTGGHVLLTSCDLMIGLTAIPSGMTSFRMHLYGSAPAAILDNAAWDLISADQSAYRGYVDFGAVADMGSTLWVQADQVNRHIKLAPGSTSLFGLLVTNGAYTPAAATVYTPRLRTASL